MSLALSDWKDHLGQFYLTYFEFRRAMQASVARCRHDAADISTLFLSTAPSLLPLPIDWLYLPIHEQFERVVAEGESSAVSPSEQLAWVGTDT